MAARTNPWAIGTANLRQRQHHGMVGHPAGDKSRQPSLPADATRRHGTHHRLSVFRPAHRPPRTAATAAEATIRWLPLKAALRPTPPRPSRRPWRLLIQQPKLPAESTIDIRLPDDNSIPNIGVHNSTNVTLGLNGPGGSPRHRQRKRRRDRPGQRQSRLGVPAAATKSIPRTNAESLRSSPSSRLKREFSDEARRQKYQGDLRGRPHRRCARQLQNVHVIRALGMGPRRASPGSRPRLFASSPAPKTASPCR